MIDKIKNIYEYYKNPKYRIMKGVCINNRCVLFMGAYPIKPKDIAKSYKIHGYCDEDFYNKHYISFENQNYTYSKSNRLCTIWTFRQLIKWRRILPRHGFETLEHNRLTNKWNNI